MVLFSMGCADFWNSFLYRNSISCGLVQKEKILKKKQGLNGDV